MKLNEIKNGKLFHGAVWIDEQPHALDLEPYKKRKAKEILAAHVADQRAYIDRLTQKVQRAEDVLKEMR